MASTKRRASSAEELYGKEKICVKCWVPKPLSDFNGRGKRGPWLQPYCKPCESEKSQKWHAQRTPEEKKASNKKSYQKKKLAIAEIYKVINEVKSGPCTDCGGRFHPVAMDFDHVEGDKIDSIAWMIHRRSASLEEVLAEIEKCQLVCSNCHRVRTFRRLGKL